MPQSRNRPKHYHRHPQPDRHHITPVKVKRSAAVVVSILTAILGLAVAYFSQGGDIFWMILGTAVGAVIGYLVGKNMDKSIQKG